MKPVNRTRALGAAAACALLSGAAFAQGLKWNDDGTVDLMLGSTYDDTVIKLNQSDLGSAFGPDKQPFEGTEITARAAMASGDPGIKGALIVGVFINSPADMAGIRAGDIVVAVEGQPVLGIRDLLDQITVLEPEQRIQVAIHRGPEKLLLDMKVTERPL